MAELITRSPLPTQRKIGDDPAFTWEEISSKPGPDAMNTIYHSTTILCRTKALWLVKTSRMTCNIKSIFIISPLWTEYKIVLRAVVVAQVAERSLPIPENPGSNPAIGNFYWTNVTRFWQTWKMFGKLLRVF